MIGTTNSHPLVSSTVSRWAFARPCVVKLRRALSILGVSTNISSPKNNNACVTALRKCPIPFRSAPSPLKISNNHPQLFLALWRLPTTTGHSSSTAFITRPRYLNAATFSRGVPYVSKSLSVIYLNSSSANRRLFCSSPLEHCAVAVCLPFSVRQGNSMSHRGHRGWGVFSSSKMTTVSRTCQCIILLYRNKVVML